MADPHIDVLYKARFRPDTLCAWRPDRVTVPASLNDAQVLDKVDAGPRWEHVITGREWPAHTDLGGYPIYYITKDGGVLSPKAANEHLALTLGVGNDPQWLIVGQEINYEDDDLYCDHSNERIPSAYGESNG